MSMLSKNLERSLHRAFGLAGERRHEYATLEHLLLAMTEDDDAVPVLKACGVDIDRLRHDLETFIDNRLKGIITQNPERAAADRGLPARRPARRRPCAVVGSQGSHGRQRAGGAVLRARQPRRVVPREPGHDPARRRRLHQPRQGQGAGPRAHPPGLGLRGGERRRGRGQAGQRGAGRLLRRPQPEGPRRPRRSADRPRARGRAHHPGAVPPDQEQPALCRRARRRQDGDRRGPGAQDRRGRGARGAEGVGDLRARHGRAAGRHALSRRLRGAAQGRAVGAQEEAQLGAVHRRDPHHHRRRRDVGRLDGRVEPA